MLSREEVLSKLEEMLLRFEHEPRRRERFWPFFLVIADKRTDPRFKEALAICNYYVENAWVFGPRAQALSSVLRKILKKFPEKEIPYWTEYAERTPLHLSES